MIFALINWRINAEKEHDFIQFWSSTLKLDNASGLIGEFLSRVQGPDFFEKITWQMEPSELEDDKSFWRSETYISLVNVGMWETLDDFERAVGSKMNADPRWMNDYEAAPRRRAVLSPSAWRIGSAALPGSSSPGVDA